MFQTDFTLPAHQILYDRMSIKGNAQNGHVKKDGRYVYTLHRIALFYLLLQLYPISSINYVYIKLLIL